MTTVVCKKKSQYTDHYTDHFFPKYQKILTNIEKYLTLCGGFGEKIFAHFFAKNVSFLAIFA